MPPRPLRIVLALKAGRVDLRTGSRRNEDQRRSFPRKPRHSFDYASTKSIPKTVGHYGSEEDWPCPPSRYFKTLLVTGGTEHLNRFAVIPATPNLRTLKNSHVPQGLRKAEMAPSQGTCSRSPATSGRRYPLFGSRNALLLYRRDPPSSSTKSVSLGTPGTQPSSPGRLPTRGPALDVEGPDCRLIQVGGNRGA